MATGVTELIDIAWCPAAWPTRCRGLVRHRIELGRRRCRAGRDRIRMRPNVMVCGASGQRQGQR